MLYPREILRHFAEECTACGLCVESCPIVVNTPLQGVDPAKIMEEIQGLFRYGKIGDLARARIYSCLFCNTCSASCPQGLTPGFCFGTGKAILREVGDPIPKGVATIIGLGKELLESTLPSFRRLIDNPDRLISDTVSVKPKSVKTVLFSSCWGLVEGSALAMTVKILERIDPGIRVLGGFDSCCGEFQFMAGHPEEAARQFDRLVARLNVLSPEKVVIFCPTCKMTFDHHHPDTAWSWTFITDFIAGHLDELGPLHKVEATVTVHDPCHFVRGITPGSESPRKILNTIPGIKIIEMENTREDALCCGAYAITGAGNPGFEFRDRRLKQAKKTGADILSLYCPGCQMILGAEGPNISLPVESILTLLGKSLGIA
jgi:heterodisulfide reductase subunit D